MLSFTLLILLIILATNSVSSQYNVLGKGFTYIGTFRTLKINAIDESNYYISRHTVHWSNAQQTCKNTFGSNSSTVSVQTEQEWDFLKFILQEYGVVTTYWTAGMYDRNSNVWRWADSSILMPWAPWDNNHPSSNPSAVHRVLIAHTNRFTAVWRTISNSQLHRFICEVPQSTPIPFPCANTDLVIVLDSSASIGTHNYLKAKNFAVKLVEEFSGHNTSRIAFLIYSDTAVTVIDIDNSLAPDDIDKVIMNAPYLKNSTATHVGINAAVIQFHSSPPNTTKNIVVITEGESKNSTLTAAAVKTAKNMGIRTFSVGITSSADKEDLLLIASDDRDNVFTTDECDKLVLLVEPLTRKICPNDST